MKRRVFITCLNKERKIFNFNLGTLIGAVVGFVIVGLSKGMIWGLGAGAVGFSIGSWISESIFKGYFQRFLYWNFPYPKDWISRNVPESSDKEEL